MKRRLQQFLTVLPLVCAGLCLTSCRENAHSDYRTIHQLVINDDLAGVTQDLKGYPGDINLIDDAGQTPLHLAAIHCRTNVLVYLLDHGAHIEARAKGDTTPLHLAAQAGCLDAVTILLSHGANINAHDRDEHTPLARAEEWHQDTVAAYLRDHGGQE